MKLRPYQEDAVAAVYSHLRSRNDNPCVVIPTGGGKTPAIATICRDAVKRWRGRVLVLAHVKELLEQTVDKLQQIAPDLWGQVGAYSAGLKSRDTEQPIIVAGIQSVYKRACELDGFDLIIIDECFVEGTLVATPAGDVPIEQIQPGTYVYNATGIGQVEALSAKCSGNLVTLEYDDGTTITCTANHPICTESGWKQAGTLAVGSMAFGLEVVRMLRGAVPSSNQAAVGRAYDRPKREALAEAEVLLNILLQDPRQSHEVGRSTTESQQYVEGDGACPESSRRQRPVDEGAEGDAGNLGGGLDRRACGRRSGPQEQTPAEMPEDGLGEPVADDGDRVGRQQSPGSEPKRTGCEEKRIPSAKRLVRISHHQRTRRRVVFNLQVKGHPSYFANGILVHNCHLIPPNGEGMYRTFLADAEAVNPKVRVIGMTATPFRMTSGLICGKDNILNHVCYEIGVKELIDAGFLSPLVSKGTKKPIDLSGLHVRGGEFIASEAEELMDSVVEQACREIVAQAHDRKSVLIFTSGVKHGNHVADVLRKNHGIEAGTVFGDTLPHVREQVLRDFVEGRLKYLVNVNVLTTGFDAPNIDCVALLRPTMSPGLYYQMVGRGFRLSPSKSDCLVLDFGGNVLRHGPVDDIQVRETNGTREGGESGEPAAKACPECQTLLATGFLACPTCGYMFPIPEDAGHDGEASTLGILSGQTTIEEQYVGSVAYDVHHKKDAPPDAPTTMRVTYYAGHLYSGARTSEWVCFEHTGWPRQKAESWWRRRSDSPVPETTRKAVDLATEGAVAEPTAITVSSTAGQKFDKIVGYELGPKPEWREPGEDPYEGPPRTGLVTVDLEDVPF